MRINCLILCLIIFLSSCSYHYYTKQEAIKASKKSDVKKYGKLVIEDNNNNILKILTRDSNYQKLDIVYEFNESGNQIKYSIIASCDSCFQKYLTKELNNNTFKWKKINDSTYLSKYSLRRYLKIHESKFSYDIVHHDLSRTEYDHLLKLTDH